LRKDGSAERSRPRQTVPRTLFVTQDFPPRLGGSQSYHWGVLQTLDPADVVIVAPDHPEAAAFDRGHPFTVHRSERQILLPTPALQDRVLGLAREHGAELVQFGHPLPVGLLGSAVRRADLPYLVFLAGAEVTLPGALPVTGRLIRRVLGRAALLIVVSSYTARQARRLTGGRVPAAVLRPAIEAERFRPPPEGPAAPGDGGARSGDDAVAGPGPLGGGAGRGGLGDGPLIVSVGRLVPRKGQDRLIDALALLSSEFPTARLAIVGDGRLAARLRARAARRGLGARVQLLGSLSGPDLESWLRRADLFASPCRNRWGGLEVEGFGIVFAEAALAGLPVLAGRSGGAPEAVREGETGIVVDGRSTAEVAEGLRRLLRLSAWNRRDMGRRGRHMALGRHSPEVVGRRYRQLLRRAAWGSPDPDTQEADGVPLGPACDHA